MTEIPKPGAIKPPSTRSEHSGLITSVFPWIPTPDLLVGTGEEILTQPPEAAQPGTTQSERPQQTRGIIRRILGR